MPSKKKKYNARFPPARIKKIMQMDEEVGKVAATVPVIISRALELFIESLIQQATQTTLSKNAKTLSSSHIKHTIESQERYRFLKELVANVPDHQVEEEGTSSANHHPHLEDNGASSVTGKKARGRPKKVKDGAPTVQKKERRKRRKESSSSESENSEETDEADEGTDEESAPPIPAGATPSTSLVNTAVGRDDHFSAAPSQREPTPPASVVPVTDPTPISHLLAESHHTLQHDHSQAYLQQEGQPADPASLSPASTFQAPAMMPAAMPMYQSMPGAATPNLFSWPASPAVLTGGFPSVAAQGSAFPGMPPAAHFPNMVLPGLGFPAVSTPLMGFHGLPGAGFPGVSPLSPGFPGVTVAGSGIPGMPAKAPAMAGASNGSQGDDDYDT